MRTCEAENCNRAVFGTCKKTRKGYCKSHQYLREDFDKRSIMQKSLDKQRNLNSKVRSLINYDNNKLLINNASENFNELQMFFSDAAKEISKHPYCMECGKYIPTKYYRAATAHILPKAIFESVATHPLNRIILGAGCGCHQKTERIDTFSKMKVFPMAIERLMQFLPLVTEKHKFLNQILEIGKQTYL